MVGIRVLHTGDLHIGNFPGPEENGENARFHDICACLDLLAEKVEAEQPDVAVIAGDVFHQARVWSDRGLRENQTAVRFLRRISDVCPVVVMRGTPNHDSEEQFNALESTFSGTGDVHIVMEPKLLKIYTGRCGWVQIACVPGFDRGYFRAKHPGLSKEEENEVFTKAIEEIIIGLKAQCDAGSPTVLVSHYTVTGCNMESGQTAFFSQFEPVVYPSTLQAADFDLVCFGHIHRPQQLDGCRNAFYCGAISALNFNDEGQERGYYIHTINDDRSVTSKFFNLPTRQYKTIRLENEDIENLNNGEYDCLPIENYDVQDAIVRVLYNCTDENNKAFNHAMLEGFLKSCGAFWVQEITPEKISITVDRRSMDADDTPEDNLVSYLTEKDYTPERIGELIEIARPLIAEATEKATQEHHAGLFVPLEIEVKNYRNYREERFSYDGIRFCTINGANGVGKSSLFMDAMLDCLYEEPREGELTGWICNDPEARSGSIMFTFRLGESTYRVTRTRAKSGKATLNIAEQVDGEWVDRSKEKFRDTQQEIINILGIDSLTLKACALIMQDQYGLFLQADKEARMSILGSILGLGIYESMETLAAEKATDTNREIRTLEDRAETITAGLPERDALADEISAAEAEKKAAEELAASKSAEVDSLKVTLNTQLEAAARVIRLNSKVSSLTSQKALKESQRTTQAGIIMNADTVLSEEADITAGVAHYAALLEQEKTLIAGKATYDTLTARKRQVETTVTAARATAAELRQKKDTIIATQITTLISELDRAPELEEKHTKYEAATASVAELEALKPEWESLKAAAEAAADAAIRVDNEHERSKAKLDDRLAALKGKVELLNNSGCPNPEKAHCKFLADALAAKSELPGVEEAIKAEAAAYEDNRRIASDGVRMAQEALEGSLYHPEEIEALRAEIRSLADAERLYQHLEPTKQNLKTLEERVEEIEARITEADAQAETATAELAEIETQLAATAAGLSEYEKLQAEIADARNWTVKEKQLPAAREKKAAAEARTKELAGEIEAIEAEITETKTELTVEQAKTIGADDLKRRVDAAEKEIADAQTAAQAAAMKLGGLKKQLEVAEDKLKQAAAIQQQVNELGVKAAAYEELKKAFSQDGIPHNVIRSIIPVFEATATNILGQMSQGHMSVEFVTEKVLKSNNKKEVTTLDIIINDSDTGRLAYMSRSGGERVKAALSVILALSEIKSSKAGVQLGFLFIDEPPFLDGPGVQAYCDALEAIQQRYSDLKVMAITHDPAMKSRFPQSVDVVKTPDGSKVIYE